MTLTGDGALKCQASEKEKNTKNNLDCEISHLMAGVKQTPRSVKRWEEHCGVGRIKSEAEEGSLHRQPGLWRSLAVERSRVQNGWVGESLLPC